MEQYLPPPPSGPSPEQFTRTYWSVPRSGTSGDAGVVEYIIPPLRNYMLSIPSQIIPPPVWWTYARHLQRFGNQQRQQMMMLGQSIAEFAILVAARDMKPHIQKEELNVLTPIILNPALESVYAHLHYGSLEDLYVDIGWGSAILSTYKHTMRFAITFFTPFVRKALDQLSRVMTDTPCMPVASTPESARDAGDPSRVAFMRKMKRIAKSSLAADRGIDPDENPFSFATEIDPQSDAGRHFSLLGRVFFKSLVFHALLRKFDLPGPVLQATVDVMLEAQSCIPFLTAMHLDPESFPKEIRMLSRLVQVFFIAIGVVGYSEQGRLELEGGWTRNIGEFAKHYLRSRDLDPAQYLQPTSTAY